MGFRARNRWKFSTYLCFRPFKPHHLLSATSITQHEQMLAAREQSPSVGNSYPPARISSSVAWLFGSVGSLVIDTRKTRAAGEPIYFKTRVFDRDT